ncbi:MAG: adenylyltransferase/cytidyltransferase family protein [Patescibacteria group bacterium]
MINKKRERATVFYQGSFDLLHYGHIRAIRKAKEQGNYLIIGLNTDKLIREYKDKEVFVSYPFRKKILEALRDVDQVVPANYFSPLNLLKKIKPDVYIICNEWKKTKQKEVDYMKSIGGKTVVIPYLKTFSSTDIKNKLAENYLKHNQRLCSECHKKM